MAYLSADEQEVLRLARTVIRDMEYDYPNKDLVCSPQEVCTKLSVLLGEEYDYQSNEVTAAAEEVKKGLVLEVFEDIGKLRSRAESLSEDGYHIYPVQYLGHAGFMFLLQAVNPVLMQSKQAAALQGLMRSIQSMPSPFGDPTYGPGHGPGQGYRRPGG